MSVLGSDFREMLAMAKAAGFEEAIEMLTRSEIGRLTVPVPGVHVNIAPLQKAGQLAADVLAKKNLDKAIADRVQWRADERRWCREGKLPKCGWWSEARPCCAVVLRRQSPLEELG